MTFNVPLQPDRLVGYESSKAYRRRCATGFWAAFVPGPVILDIGYRGGVPTALPILQGAIGVELGHLRIDEHTPTAAVSAATDAEYSGLHLPFASGSVDCVHASHILEHVTPPSAYLQEWYRVLRIGGTMILMLPHAFLYERKLSMPSRWSGEHLRAYTPSMLLTEIEVSLPPNGYRVRHLADNDEGYDYTLPSTTHPTGCLEIECVIEKRQIPAWSIEY